MHQQLGDETKQEVLVETHGEAEIGPVVAELKALESITLEVHLAIEELLIEDLHGDLALALVGGTVMLTVEVKVVLHGTTGVLGLFILTGGDGRSNGPEGHQDRNGCKDGEEDGGVEASIHLAGQVPRDQDKQGEEQDVGEAITAGGVCWNGSIFDSGIL